ncbi:MAG: pilus assembly protein PilM [Armatimonadetes bacterium]|nr:pilus assembly protein PilM [Armatimonadota bacterium]
MTILGSKTSIGVDIGAGEIKVVELRRAGGGIEVTQAARISLSEDGDRSAALRQFVMDTETQPARAAASLPTHLCSVKFARIPRAKPADMARMARFEAESQIPLPLADVVWDYAVVSAEDDAMCHLIIGGARRSDVEQWLGDLERAGLSPDAILISAPAAVGALDLSDEESVLVAQIGAQWTDLCIVQAGRLTACRTVRVGRDGLSQAFAQDLGVCLDDGEDAVRARGLAHISPSEDGAGSSSVEAWAESLALEMRRSAVSVPSKESDQRPRQAVIVGEIADVPAVAEDLSRRTGLHVSIGDPWRGLETSLVVGHSMKESPAAFAAATGLALSGFSGTDGINLMPHHRSEERARRRRQLITLSSLGAVALALLAALLAGRSGIAERSAELNLIRSEVGLVRQEIQRAGPDLRVGAANVGRMVRDIEEDKVSPLELLRRISEVLPRGIWLTEFASQRGKTLVLKGSGLSNSAIADSVDMLNQLGLFKDVTLDFSSLAKSGQTYEFQITCSLPERKSAGGTDSTGGARRGGGQTTGIVVQ